jgi:hypothetical protein
MQPRSKVELFAAIRRDARIEKLSIHELSRRYGVHRRLVREALTSPWPAERKAIPPRRSVVDPYKSIIDAILRTDLDAPRKQRHTAKRVFDRLVAEHDMDNVSYGRIRDYVKRRKPEIVIEGGRGPPPAIVASWGTPLAPPPHVRAHSLLLDPMVVVLPDDHPLATGQPADTELQLEQLRDESWVSILVGHAAREQFHDAAREAGFTPTVRFETESYDVAQALAGTGIAVALVSRLALTHAPGTTHRELAHPRPYRQFYAVTKTDASLTPLADMLIDLLCDVARDITATWEAPLQEKQRSSNSPHGA